MISICPTPPRIVVLGAYNGTKETLDDPINAPKGITYYNSITGGLPEYVTRSGLIIKYNYYIIYWAFNREYFIAKTYLTSGWSDWKKVTIDMPDFYKDYNNISALAGDIGLNLNIHAPAMNLSLAVQESTDISVPNTGIFVITENNQGIYGLIAKKYTGLELIKSQYVGISDSGTEALLCYHKSTSKITIKNNHSQAFAYIKIVFLG